MNLEEISLEIEEKHGFRISNIVSAKVAIKDLLKFKEAYIVVDQLDDINVIRVVNNLMSHIPFIKFIIIYQDSLLGEILLHYHEQPKNSEANSFLNDLSKTPIQWDF